MAWGHRSLVRALLLGLVAQLTIASSDADAGGDADVKAKSGGSTDGLAYDPIDKVEIMTGNATGRASRRAPVDGWWESKICSGDFCVYTNRQIAGGRGMALVTRFHDFQKLQQAEDHINKGENKIEDPSLFTETEVVDKGIGITATKNIRRGKKLMSWSPVLMVHQDLFTQVKKRTDRARLLEAAVSYLPDATRETFDRQRIAGLAPGENRKIRSVEDIILGAPFELTLGYEMHVEQHSKHYVHYPEMAVVQHDCRPNVAWYIDNNYALRTTVARRVQAGDELTVAYIDVYWPRYKRQAWIKKYRGLGKPCSCQKCSPKGKEEELKQSDERVREIQDILAELKNHDSKIVTEEMIDKIIVLAEQERLSTKMAEIYENAAHNYNYLGLDVKAKKYSDLAVQAGIVEGGPDDNSVIMNRIMGSDIKGHWSYRFTLKRRGK